MGRLTVFNSISLDGYFVDMNGDMSWAHTETADKKWDAFVAGNANSGGILVFGRVTYEMMASYWSTPFAAKNDPVVAKRMNEMPKIVFSRTMKKASWNNTTLIKRGMVPYIRKMRKTSEDDMAILGSGSIVTQLAAEGLIDEFQLVMIPIVLGGGRTLFEGVDKLLRLKLTASRTFANGNVLLCYTPVKDN